MGKSQIVTFTLIAIALVGCKSKLDPQKIETSINDGLKAKELSLQGVTCPPREAKAGDSFECEGKTKAGDKVSIHVEQKDDQGNIVWEIKAGKLASQAKLGTELAPSLGKGAIAKCPNETVVIKPGLTFTCDAMLDGQPGKITFTSKDDQGNFSMESKLNNAPPTAKAAPPKPEEAAPAKGAEDEGHEE